MKTIVRERASDQRFITMFLDEARLAATLNHQNVAQVYEVDQRRRRLLHGDGVRPRRERAGDPQTTSAPRLDDPLQVAVMIISGTCSAPLLYAIGLVGEHTTCQVQPVVAVYRCRHQHPIRPYSPALAPAVIFVLFCPILAAKVLVTI